MKPKARANEHSQDDHRVRLEALGVAGKSACTSARASAAAELVALGPMRSEVLGGERPIDEAIGEARMVGR